MTITEELSCIFYGKTHIEEILLTWLEYKRCHWYNDGALVLNQDDRKDGVALENDLNVHDHFLVDVRVADHITKLLETYFAVSVFVCEENGLVHDLL